MFLDLRLPRTTFVAGAVIQAEVQVRNTTSDDVMVEPTVWGVPDGPDATNALLQADARAFPTLVKIGSPGPAFHGAQVPSGQTWAIPSVAQLPFEAAPPVHLQASVGLVTPVAPGRFESGVRVIADLPLHLMAATAAQELHLELHADHRQWCLRAADARGGTPAGPLLVRMTARGPGMYLEGSPSRAGPAGTWAARWGPHGFPSTEAFTASFWVGGPDYVTAMVQ